MWDGIRRAFAEVVESLASRAKSGDDVGYSETLDELAGLIKSKKQHEVPMCSCIPLYSFTATALFNSFLALQYL